MDAAIDVVGCLLPQALDCVRKGGDVIAFGLNAHSRQTIDQADLAMRGVTIHGTFIGHFTFETTARMLAAGVVDLRRLITDRFDIDDFGEALAALRSGSSCKVRDLPERTVTACDQRRRVRRRGRRSAGRRTGAVQGRCCTTSPSPWPTSRRTASATPWPTRAANSLACIRGVPLPQRTTGYSGVLPDIITIFKGPHERICGSRGAAGGADPQKPWLHEIGHYFRLRRRLPARARVLMRNQGYHHGCAYTSKES